MAGEWEATLLRDLLVTTKDGDWGKENPEDGYVPYHIIRGTDFPDVRVGDLSSVPQRYLPEHTVKRRTLEPDDILIETAGGTRDRPTGRTLLITEKVLSRFRGPVTCASFARFLRIDRKQANPRFVFWYLQHLYDKGEMSQHQVQHTGVARFQYTRFAETQNVPLPPLAEQKAIAAVLGALDDKIELNRRMNATLEAMARALFQSWFIDFDPVRQNMDRKQNQPSPQPSPSGRGRSEAEGEGVADLAALFPEHLEDSPLGHIPKGWTAGKLGDIGTNSRRGVQPGDIAPNTPYIALEHMPRRCIALGDWDDSADVASGKSAFKKGEILFGKLRPYFHKVGVAPFDGVCSTDILVLAPKSPEWFGFLLGHASSDELIQFTDLASTGTKMPRTNWSDISSFKVALPPKPIAAAFTRIIQPMLDRIHANLHQSRTLATLRDTLLPKLLSGELSVTKAVISSATE
jgi:type I restriction enzyme S subunit